MQNNSVSPSESLRASEKHRSSTDYSIDSKKRKAEEKDSMSRYVSGRDGLQLGPAAAGGRGGAENCRGTQQHEARGVRHAFRWDFEWGKAGFG